MLLLTVKRQDFVIKKNYVTLYDLVQKRQCCGTVMTYFGSDSDFGKVLASVPEQDQNHRHFGVKFPACQKTSTRHTNVAVEREEAGLQYYRPMIE
jgi:hypothetical protein